MEVTVEVTVEAVEEEVEREEEEVEVALEGELSHPGPGRDAHHLGSCRDPQLGQTRDTHGPEVRQGCVRIRNGEVK